MSQPEKSVAPTRNIRPMMAVADRIDRVHDAVHHAWHDLRFQRRLASVLILSFVGALGAIELARQGLVSQVLGAPVPTNHFHALSAVFTLLLLFEMVELVMSLSRSVSNAVGKQFQILSLILLRQSFKELAGFDEPLAWDQVREGVGYILSDAVGALAVFVGLGIYARLQRHRPITADDDEQRSFVTTKKLLALVMLAGIVYLTGEQLLGWLGGHPLSSFFERFYTALIFVDVLIVLVSLRYSTNYCVIFRYFGFAVATVLIRLALTAPRYLDAGLSVAAVAFSIALTVAYNRSVLCPDRRPGAPEGD